MRAYAVLDGGGVKGAALAGCLSAAETSGITFQAYGGSSAGAIVSLLASIGYTGREIRNLLSKDLQPKNILGDRGGRLIALRDHVDSLTAMFGGDLGWLGKLRILRQMILKDQGVIKTLWSEGGLYDGRHIKSILRRKVIEKLPIFAGKRSITFDDLVANGAKPLKIVASDLTENCVAVFPSSDGSYWDSVVGAVVASASYPFVFKPVSAPFGDYHLADGGLVSNLPVFLFAQEHLRTRFPVFAFDLVTDKGEGSQMSNLSDICLGLLSTTLEASDSLLANSVPGVYRVPVPIPSSVSTLKIEINDEEIESLFNAGFRAATEFFSGFSPLADLQRAGEHLKRKLWTVYGPPSDYQPLLWALNKMIEERTSAQGLRSHIMLPTGRGTRIVGYCIGHRDLDQDTDLELGEMSGCAGRALVRKVPIVADLQRVQADFQTWGFTEKQRSRIPVDRRSVICTPIFPNSLESDMPLATLSVDSSTPLNSTGWIIDGHLVSEEFSVSRDVLEIIQEWARVIARLIYPALR